MSHAIVRIVSSISWQPGEKVQACPRRPQMPDHGCARDVQHHLCAMHRYIKPFMLKPPLCCGTLKLEGGSPWDRGEKLIKTRMPSYVLV